MQPFYVALHATDPAGPARMKAGQTYGGDANFFMVSADRFADALLTVIDAVEANRLRVDRIRHGGPVAYFDPEHFPARDFDFEAMRADVEASGHLFALAPRSFEPLDLPSPKGVTVMELDLFDPEAAGEGPYAGELVLAAHPGAVVPALRAMIGFLDEAGVTLKAVEDVRDGAEVPPDQYGEEWDAAGLVVEAEAFDGPVFSSAFAYESEED